MKAKQLLTLASLTLAAGAVLADDVPGVPLTRAQVAQSVLAARAAGTLSPAGPSYDGPPARTVAGTPSGLTRATTKAEVLRARTAGTLAHAGSVAPEEEMAYAQAHPSTSTLTRAEVNAEVLQARANDQLVPAGEAEYSARASSEPVIRIAARSRSSVGGRAGSAN
jgi:hypothetical protein